MANNNLVIAIVFAALFGAAMLWLAIYYLHRYIHRNCYALGHWFHVLLSHASEAEDYSRERATNTNSSSSRTRSTRRAKSDNRSSRSKRRHRTPRGSPRDEMRERVHGWSVETEDEGIVPAVNCPRDGYREELVEWETREPVSSEPSRSDSGQVAMLEDVHPAMPKMVPPSPFPIARPHVKSMRPAMPQMAPSSHLSFMASPDVEEYEPEEVIPGKTDFIHICDEYPAMVLEVLQRQRASSKVSSNSAFRFPRCPQLQTRLCNTAPTSYPRQWMDTSE
jgi:hypothetical protein